VLSRVLLAAGAAVLIAVGTLGCSSVGYLAHVSAGQLGVLYARERLTPERIARLSDGERDGLQWLEQAREYAASLGLARSSSYRHVIERSRENSVQVVVASPVDRLEPVTWWFPFVGRIAYRGYFDAGRAQSFAKQLSDRGLDTYVRPAILYSTLGYFDDPIPRTVLGWSAVDLADVTIHELVHETIFVSGDIAYNEALASFIAEQATLQMFADRPADHELAEKIFADRATYSRTVETLAAELRALYATGPTREEALRRRAEIFDRYQHQVFPAQPWRTKRYSGFADAPLSNAFIVAEQTYSAALPCFARELAELGGDLRAFIARHREQPGMHGDCTAS
jgi:predicted aminopeptidase